MKLNMPNSSLLFLGIFCISMSVIGFTNGMYGDFARGVLLRGDAAIRVAYFLSFLGTSFSLLYFKQIFGCYKKENISLKYLLDLIYVWIFFLFVLVIRDRIPYSKIFLVLSLIAVCFFWNRFQKKFTKNLRKIEKE